MRNLLAVLLIAVSLGGCATGTLNVNKPVPEGTTQSPLQLAQAGVKQAVAVHASITATLEQNFKDGIITKEQKDAYAVRTRSILTDIKAADALVGTGNITDAQAKLKLINGAILILQQELAKQAQKGQ